MNYESMKDLIEALQILLKYDTQESRSPTHCEHDYFYVAIYYEHVSEEDMERLNVLGFFIDREYGGEGFGSFRFGSC